MAVEIREVVAADKVQWVNLFKLYLEFYETEFPQSSIDLVFQRVNSPVPTISSLVAEVDRELVGFTNFHFQSTTWADTSHCYLEDLYVLESQRGQGVARQLISAVKDRARAAGSTELFWITRASNLRAQALYDKIAVKRDFIRYEIDLTPLEGDN